MRDAAIYGAVAAFAVFMIGLTTGMGGPLATNLIFSALMGVFAGGLFALVQKYVKRKRD